MTIPIPSLPFFAIAVIALIASVIMKLIGRGDPSYWLMVAGVCALIAMAG